MPTTMPRFVTLADTAVVVYSVALADGASPVIVPTAPSTLSVTTMPVRYVSPVLVTIYVNTTSSPDSTYSTPPSGAFPASFTTTTPGAT